MSPVHVVVVGHGMVGARFAEEVRRHDPEGRRVRLTILAAEPRPAYNRVLLPSLLSGVLREEDFTATEVAGLPVLSGRRTSPDGSVLPPDAPMSLRVAAIVTGIDPSGKTVLVRRAIARPVVISTRDRARAGTRTLTGAEETGDAGAKHGAASGVVAFESIGYDILVLATGARAAIPPLPGVCTAEAGSIADRSQGHAPDLAVSSLVGQAAGAPEELVGQAAGAPEERDGFPPSETRSPGRSRGGAGGLAGFSSAGVPSPDPAAGHGLESGGDQPPARQPLASAAGLVGLPALSSQPGDADAGAEGSGARTRSVPSRLSSDVAVLHSLADARHIAAFAQSARRTGGRVAVLGGGVLGLEAARALAARGTAVTVVHRGGHLMDRQLDAPAGRVLAVAMRRTGVEVSLGVGAAWWEPGRGLWLTDGQLVRASGLVLCTGTMPCTELARDAGLRLTESGAVTVDDTLATSAPDIYAIGDCAGHPGAAGGLVQPGWEQAAVLASRLTGTAPRARYRGSGAVTRLKAAGIELTAVGTPAAGDADNSGGAGPTGELEVLRFEDPARERYAKLVLSEDRVVGAVLIGLPDAAAGIVQLYDRDAPAPADRLALLLGRGLPPEAGGGAAGPAALPDYAVLCRCNMVTKGQLRDAWYRGACGRDALSAATRAATGCGTCGDDLSAVAAWLADSDPSQQGARNPAGASQARRPGGRHREPDGGHSADFPAGPPGGRHREPAGGQPADPQQKEAALR